MHKYQLSQTKRCAFYGIMKDDGGDIWRLHNFLAIVDHLVLERFIVDEDTFAVCQFFLGDNCVSPHCLHNKCGMVEKKAAKKLRVVEKVMSDLVCTNNRIKKNTYVGTSDKKSILDGDISRFQREQAELKKGLDYINRARVKWRLEQFRKTKE